MTLERLNDTEIRTRLSALEGWEWVEEDKSIARKFVFDDFDDAMGFINAVAEIARDLDHHPEWHNVYNEVAISLTTHDADGLTARDFAFATRVEALLEEEEDDQEDDPA